MHHPSLRCSGSGLAAAALLATVAVAAGPLAADDLLNDTQTAPRWTFLGPEGGRVQALAVGFRNGPILHVGLATGGVYNGAVGQRLHADREGLPTHPILSLAVDPTEPSIVYASVAGSGGPVFKSYNGGGTWEHRGDGLPPQASVQELAIDPLHPRVVFAATSEGIYRSANGGHGWHPRSRGLPLRPVVEQPPYIHSLVVDPRSPDIVYAAADEGVFRSSDGGETWSWDPSSALLSYFDPIVAVDPASPRTVYLGSERGLFRSTDGGKQWREVGQGLAGSFRELRALVVSPFALEVPSCGEAWAVVATGLFTSRDCGETWAPAGQRGLRGQVTALAIDPGDPDRLWVGTTLGAFESGDHGATWTPINWGMRALEVSSLAFGPELSPVLFAGSQRHGLFRRAPEGPWKRIVPEGDEALAGPVVASPSDPTTLYAAGLSGPSIARSSDGGESWSSTLLTEDCVVVESIDADPATPTTVFARVRPVGGACFKGCTLYRSRDGAASWTCLPVFARGDLAVDPLHPATIWIATLGIPEEGPSIYRSLDAGDSWHWVASVGRDTWVEALAAGPDVLFAGLSDGRVLRSSDGGEAWDDASAGLPTTKVTALTLDPGDPDHVFAAFANQGVYRSSNGGATWESLHQGLPAGLIVAGLLFDPDTSVLFAASVQGVYRLEL